MLKKVLIFLKTHRKQLLKYFIVGSSAFVLDIGTLLLLKECGHLHPALAVALNQIFIINYVFFLNKYWSFQSQGQTRRQIVRFLVLVIWNYFFSIAWMWMWIEVLRIGFQPGGILGERDIGYLIGRLLNVLLAVSWNFLLYKYWIYSVHNSNLT